MSGSELRNERFSRRQVLYWWACKLFGVMPHTKTTRRRKASEKQTTREVADARTT